MKLPTRGLYAITQTDNKSMTTILSEIEQVLSGGAVMVQYRDKNPQNARLLASELVVLCHQYHVPLIINDDVELALQVAADGVHLGKEDGVVAHARQRLGHSAIIGVSCYNSVDRAIEAQRDGADYVAFGRFFTSSSKPLAAPAELHTLQEAKRVLTVPVVAIGGILPDNGGQLLNAGADMLAVIGGLFTAQPQHAARAYHALF